MCEKKIIKILPRVIIPFCLELFDLVTIYNQYLIKLNKKKLIEKYLTITSMKNGCKNMINLVWLKKFKWNETDSLSTSQTPKRHSRNQCLETTAVKYRQMQRYHR